MPGWEEGNCESETGDRVGHVKYNITQGECLEFCEKIPESTGCQYEAFDSRKDLPSCLAFTYPIKMKRNRESLVRCEIFLAKSDDAAKKARARKSNTPGIFGIC